MFKVNEVQRAAAMRVFHAIQADASAANAAIERLHAAVTRLRAGPEFR